MAFQEPKRQMKLSRKLIILFLLLSTVESYAQITTSTSRNESNIYFNVADTLIKKILEKERNVKIVITSEDYILKLLPETFSNLPVIKTNNFKRKRKFEGAIWVKIDPLQLDKDKVKIYTTIRRQTNKQMIAWESGEQIGSYILIYKYDNSLNEYKLLEIEKGMFIY